MAEPLLATTFRFSVTLTRSPDGADSLGDGGFQECGGLEVEMEVSEYPEGGRNDALIQRAGRAKYPKLVLKRGMFHAPGGTVNAELWQWLADAVGGVRPIRRYDGEITMLGAGGAEVAKWAFTRALPAKIVGPQLNARTGEVAVEEIQLAHEGLRLVAP
jgi:phage tail-like protein